VQFRYETNDELAGGKHRAAEPGNEGVGWNDTGDELTLGCNQQRYFMLIIGCKCSGDDDYSFHKWKSDQRSCADCTLSGGG